jgi:hypothetical protein
MTVATGPSVSRSRGVSKKRGVVEEGADERRTMARVRDEKDGRGMCDVRGEMGR